MSLLRLSDAELHFGTQVLLDKLDLTVSKGERLGLLGRNGVGKTTLFRVLTGEQGLDDGERWIDPSLKMARLEQELPLEGETSVFDWVAGGLDQAGELLIQYSSLLGAESNADLTKMANIQEALDACDGWTLQNRVETTLTQLGLSGSQLLKDLSGGWRRRVALGRALVSEPDLLLLDEPTNHLDIPTIVWLEQQLKNFSGAIILITHDRRFLQAIANRIGELDRGQLTIWEGTYQDFLKHRAEQLAAEATANALFDKRLAQEEVWIRQGIKARRTRNEGRVRRLEAMREDRAARRSQAGKANITIETASRSGKLVAEVEKAGVRFGDHTVIQNVNTIIQRGDRIGIVGRNGAGKTTLIKMVLGELEPSFGQVKTGSKLQVAYSDQLRGHLDPEGTLIDNICGGQEFIEIEGKKRHAISYLGDFLFSPDRVRAPTKVLSGGERNRAILAKLFTQPANLLVLDEPTNDLDIETLELLEEVLLEFSGTVILVSHDRDFMDRVVTSLLVIDEQGHVEEQAGNFSDWEARGGALLSTVDENRLAAKAIKTTATSAVLASEVNAQVKKKLNYKEQRELDTLPDLIAGLEAQQAALEEATSSADFYAQDQTHVKAVLAELTRVSESLDAALDRLIALEG
ncbi:ATP-binding cassette domain-containing protein [Luminiphilus sp.]|nr:ATP-binding cassette domain-containing protein [Luminiphilus sp.]MDA8754334.1 ATP-binding cassette domain-containing protein [Luminiphilus sp.]MDA8947119.1 ATP-binding cassette domain-containing protein [Luminiphilus sp.]MDB2315805.1 ATP-binding cassette domain-containing protein [Luminiphilus sp.]MDB2378657.1 ATP-binding cassette domain-containing protein [Luminiphilus sp.]